MRIAAVYLPLLRVELARARGAEDVPSPMAVVIARPGSVVKDERSLLGGTRLDAVSCEARAWGVRRGETIASARARCSGLSVRVVAEGEVRGALESVAESGLSFGRTASIDEARDIVLFDVTGCGHLFGGERGLALALAARVEAMHHGEVRVCIADGPRVSASIAHAIHDGTSPAPPGRGPHQKSAPFVVPEGKNAEAIRALPIRALPIDERTIQWLVRLGLVRIGDLQKLPARGLATRLGAAHAEVMALLAGDDGAPLSPYVPKDVPEERAELEYGVEKSEALVFVAKMLCDRLEARLAGRAMAATRLELELSLDRAVAREAELPSHASLVLSSPAPLSLAGEMLTLVRSRIESWTLVAPVLAVALRATELARKDGRALDLFEPLAKADRALPRLVAELAAEIGPEHVGLLSLADTWIPEARTVLRPFGCGESPRATLAPLVSLSPEPSRILAHPSRVDGTFRAPPVGRGPHQEDARPMLHLARLEAAEWWRHGVRARDSFASWLPAEKRVAWLEVDAASGDSLVKGWFD